MVQKMEKKKKKAHLLLVNLLRRHGAEDARRLHLLQVLPEGAGCHRWDWASKGEEVWRRSWSWFQRLRRRQCGLRVEARADPTLELLHVLRRQQFGHGALVDSLQVAPHFLQAVLLIERDCSAQGQSHRSAPSSTLREPFPFERSTYRTECTLI